jgi:hypothetical protein
MKPLAMSMLKQIIGTLRNICSSFFEAILFAGIFSFGFVLCIKKKKWTLQ